MDKNDSIDEFGLCSSSESVPKTLDKPVTWYGHRVMQTVLVILLLCYCTWRHKWLSLKKSWSWHIKVWENQYSETLFLYICWVEFILSIMFAFLLPCPTTPGSIPRRGALQNTPGSHVTHPTARKNLLWDWDSGTVGQRRHRRCWVVVLLKKKALQLGKCWLDVYGIPKWSQIEIQKVPKCPKIFQIASH